MATTKKSTAAKTSKKDETAEMAAAAKAAAAVKKAEAEAKTTATKVEAPAVKEEKKAPAKKAPAKKAAPKKVAPKKPAALKAETAVETKVDFFVEYAGVQVSIDEVIKNVKATYGKDAKNISVYLKPEESKAYFVADGEEKDMDVFFC
ncbi:MAG: hypothetical protein J1E85_00640 [Ruminococcus sp.]|nr:hypothetical protein [Ruminococcus sp.]